jgi:hypothetical protein
MNTSKIIRAVVGGGRYTTTAPIMKEDYGIILKIENLELPASYEVDFSNSRKGGDSVTVIGDEDGVLIPTQFIRDGKDVFAFLYWVGPDYGRTVYTFCIPNRIRPDRTNEQPEPEQQSVIDQTIAALNTAVARTAQDVIDADASAQSAAESADLSGLSARSAGEYASQASASATSAAQSAQQASASAGAASAAATSASASAASAYTDAERAEQAASTAGYLDVEIVDGRLIYTRTDAVDVDFALDNGRLIMEAI